MRAVDATVYVNPVKNFANVLGISDLAYNTASEIIQFVTSIGCVAAGGLLQYSMEYGIMNVLHKTARKNTIDSSEMR